MTGLARWGIALAVVHGSVCGWASGLGAQGRGQSRFFITSVGDSTFTFVVARDRWVRAGMRGRAVDPAQRDTFVATFRVLTVDRGEATALVTGQTTDIRLSQVAVLDVPSVPWYRRQSFWLGLLLGSGVGVAVGRVR